MTDPSSPDDELLQRALKGLRKARARLSELEAERRPALAVCGVGLRLPGSVEDLEGFARVARGEQALFGPVPADRWPASDGTGADHGAFLDAVWSFDPEAFGLSEREARRMDPAQRLLLIGAREAAASAGASLPEATGVYVATGLADHAASTLYGGSPDAWSATGVLDSVQAGRVAYTLGLSGPAIAVDTACSGGLVALHLAAQDLRAGRCEAALVGAANVILRPDVSRAFAAMGALSPTGRCRPLSAQADGYVRAEGMVVLLLTRLDRAQAEGWPVLGVFRGSAVNQDGRSNGLTAPRGPAQRAVVQAAWADAGVEPSEIGLVGLHGTGTPLGDPIEVRALAEALGSEGSAVGVLASKARWGHTEPAAGLVGVVEALQALREGAVPGLPGLREVSPEVGAVEGRLRWPTGPSPVSREAVVGVSAFGFAGTNAHVVLTGPPEGAPEVRAPGLAWSLRVLRPGEASVAAVPGYEIAWEVYERPEASSMSARVVDGEPASLLAAIQAGGPVVVRLPCAPDEAQPAQAASAAVGRVAISEGLPVSVVWGVDAPEWGAPGHEVWWDGQAWRAPALRSAEVGTDREPVQGRWAVVGGSGALGRWVVAHLRERGASEVVVTGRAPAGSCGVDVRLDLDDPDSVVTASEAIGEVAGVVIVAGGSEDRALASVDARALEAGLARARQVVALAERLAPARVCVVGTASEDLGVPGQAVYAAAAAWVGASGVEVVRFGAFDRGMADEVADRLRERGIDRLPVDALDTLWRSPRPRGALAWRPEVWARQLPSPRSEGLTGVEEVGSAPRSIRSMQEAWTIAREAVGEALETDPSRLDPDAGLFDLGMDSMSALLLARAISRRTGVEAPETLAFSHSSLRALASWLGGEVPEGRVGEAPRVAGSEDEELVISGFAGRFPGGLRSAAALFDRVRSGEPLWRDPPADRFDARALAEEVGLDTLRGAYLDEDVYAFDPAAHGLSPREARLIDPTHRLLLELASEVLGQVGADAEALRGRPVGVFVGLDDSEYADRLAQARGADDRLAAMATGAAFAAGRLAHRFGTRGPAVVVQTACSSALVALASAADAIRSGRADSALVGAAHLVLGGVGTRRLAGMGALSPTGRCRPFHPEADGFVRGEGGGMLWLERRSTAEAAGRPILAVLRGEAVVHDGPAAGLTAPSAQAQAQVQREALARAGVAPSEVGWLEAHGTGTRLGDPVELGAIVEVHRGRATPLQVSSCKSVVGHLEAAAGMASLAVVIEGLRRGERPLLRGAQLPEGVSEVGFSSEGHPWSGPRIAAISGFGMSGTNVHVVLEAGPEPVEAAPPVERGSLRHLEVPWVASDRPHWWRPLAERRVEPPPRVWLVPGPGAAAGGRASLRSLPMGVSVVGQVGAQLDPETRDAWWRALAGEGEATEAASLARFTVAVALGQALRAWGATPAAVGGQGEGALAAAVICGALSLEDGVRAVRGWWSSQARLPSWEVWRLPVSLDEAQAEAVGHVVAVTAPDAVWVTGPPEVAEGVGARPGVLRVGRWGAVHTPAATSEHQALVEVLAGLSWNAAEVPWLDPCTGQVADPSAEDVWARAWTEAHRWDRMATQGAGVVELAFEPSMTGACRRLGVEHVALGGPVGGFERGLELVLPSSCSTTPWVGSDVGRGPEAPRRWGWWTR